MAGVSCEHTWKFSEALEGWTHCEAAVNIYYLVSGVKGAKGDV